MCERYDEIAAAHYSAYRPPLHQIILRRALSGGESFSVGLDVGCGTGYSTVALAEHCVRVYGIDPSPSMLREATPHERVIYVRGAGEHIPVQSRVVDVVTFAGSLFHTEAGATREQINRVCRPGAVVVVYDFELLLGEVLRRCGMDPRADGSDYDHRANFSGARGFAEVTVGSDRLSLQVTASELAHVLLSDSSRFDRFAKRHHTADPFLALTGELRSAYDRTVIEAAVYYSRYRMANK